jgi:hypothetical protein
MHAAFNLILMEPMILLVFHWIPFPCTVLETDQLTVTTNQRITKAKSLFCDLEGSLHVD